MNVDAWLSGEEGTRVVDVMAAAMFATVSRQPWDQLHQYDKSDYQKYAAAALRAALSLTTTEPCPKCGGSGLGKPYDCAEHGSHTPSCAGSLGGNPDCKGGTVPGEPALLSALVEQIGWVSAWTRDGSGNYACYEIGTPKFNALWEVGPKAGVEPVYRLLPLEGEAETP